MAGEGLFSIRIHKNILPQLERALRPAYLRIMREEAHKAAQDWAADVRVDTGYYRDSIHVEFDSDFVHIGSDAHYAVYNEYGTRHMSARPSATQASLRMKERLATRFDKLEASMPH